MTNEEILAKYGPIEGTRRIEANCARAKKYKASHREERNAYDRAYNASHREERNAYSRAYRQTDAWKVAIAKTEAKRSAKACTDKRVDNIARKACQKFFGMKQKEFVAFRKALGYSFHHAFGLERPDEGVFLPTWAHKALHVIYGRANEKVTMNEVADYCAHHNIHFIVVSKCPLLAYNPDPSEDVSTAL